MNKTPLDMVTEFHDAFGVARGCSNHNYMLRSKLIYEEHEEVSNALVAYIQANRIQADYEAERLAAGQWELFPLPYVTNSQEAKRALAKELADLVYVVYGAADVFDIDLDRVLEEVHQSNMSKLGEDGKPIHRDDGKVLKGPNYREPDLRFVR